MAAFPPLGGAAIFSGPFRSNGVFMSQRSMVSSGLIRTDSSTDLATVLIETYSVNDAMNQILLAHLDPKAWRAEPLGPRGSGRTIAAIFAHLHNSRLVWIRNSAPHLKSPKALDPYRCTMRQAATAHKKSAAQCLRMLSDACREAQSGA